MCERGKKGNGERWRMRYDDDDHCLMMMVMMIVVVAAT